MGFPHDLPPGEHLVALLQCPSSHSWSRRLCPRKTIRQHVDNLWRLGGEIIRDLNDDPPRRKITADRLLRQAIHADGGPLLYHGSEDEQRSFDSTCRKLHRFPPVTLRAEFGNDPQILRTNHDYKEGRSTQLRDNSLRCPILVRPKREGKRDNT